MLGSSGLVGTSSGGGGGGGGSGGEAHAESGSEPAVGPTAASSSMGSEAGVSGGGGGGGDMFEGGGSGGNRWPRQETLALLKIRSDMDVVFRDSSLKGPLWEQVSRKMAELGYHRSAKKCKEKFENVYKYHRRTKDGRVGKSDGKTYRFFDQLEAFEHHQGSSSGPHVMTSLPPLPPPPPRHHHEEAVPVTMVMPPGTTVTVPSTGPHPITVLHASPNIPGHQGYQIPRQQTVLPGQSSQAQVERSMPLSPSTTQSSSSSTSSDEEVMVGRKKKRKWKDLFGKMMKEVVDKQEELQRRFLEAVEKREQDRLARDEAWKRHEIARLNREHEVLVQERSMAAAKDAALISFLQKLSEQQQINIPFPVQIETQVQTQVAQGTKVNTSQPQQQQQPQPQTSITQVLASLTQPQPQPQAAQSLTQLQVPQPPLPQVVTNVDPHMSNNGDDQTPLTPVAGASSSRWPKAEVEALINMRRNLEQKYQDNGPKGPLWEEISAGMKRIGYNRNAKRCKEKWENINKYFKKVKESNKKRPEDSKTCPYFHQLDALYREKGKIETTPTSSASYQPTATTTAEMGSVGPVQIQPGLPWPAQQGGPRSESDEQDEYEENEDDDDDDDDDHGSGQFEIVPNNAATTTTATSRAE